MDLADSASLLLPPPPPPPLTPHPSLPPPHLFVVPPPFSPPPPLGFCLNSFVCLVTSAGSHLFTHPLSSRAAHIPNRGYHSPFLQISASSLRTADFFFLNPSLSCFILPFSHANFLRKYIYFICSMVLFPLHPTKVSNFS